MQAEMAEANERQQVEKQLSREYGCQVESVRFLMRGGPLGQSVYVARLRMGLGKAVELMFAGGLLIGIPPKKRWQH